MADPTAPTPPKPPTGNFTWRLYARVRIATRIKVHIYIGEPDEQKFYHTDLVEQTATLGRLARMLRKLQKAVE